MKMKSGLCIITSMIVALALASCKGDDGDTITEIVTEYETVTTPVYSGITVTGSGYPNIDTTTGLPTSAGYDNSAYCHDPMTINVDGTFYAFGSHFAVVKSDDLVKWEQVVGGDGSSWSSCVSVAENLYGSGVTWWSDVLKGSWSFCAYDSSGNQIDEDDYTETFPSTWAPSVIEIDGTYYMYYSYTSYFSGRSVIGRVSSTSITGPYKNNEIILVSEGSKSGTGANGPNCIDEEVFRDASGNLWMVYGSWYGGVFLIQLESDGTYSGFDFEEEEENFDTSATNGSGYFWDQDVTYVQDNSYYYGLTNSVYGKRLWYMGYRYGVEGPFIFYNKDTNYYYLMVSEGDLSTVYNMRVARCSIDDGVDGTYLCIQGGDVTSYTGTGGGRVGNKLAGNYHWAEEDTSYYALGHNSVISKENAAGDTEYFVVCHVRTALSGAHHIETRQLYFNAAGWPVMSPNQYVGESLVAVTMAEAAGTWDVIEHEVDTVEDVAESSRYVFDEGGTIYEEDGETQAGTWLITTNGSTSAGDDGGCYVTVVINDTTYEGVIAPAWRAYYPKGIWCMTATSSAGRPMWANQAGFDE